MEGMRSYLVEKLFDLFELLRCKFARVEVLDDTAKGMY